jgi:hypothetical protein
MAYLDDDSAWWSGLQHCAAVVALAAASVVAPVQAIQVADQPQDEPIPPSTFHLDEDLYQPPAAWIVPVEYPQPYSFEQNESGNLRGHPDEDYWQNTAAPQEATLEYPQQFSFEQNETAGSLRGQPDEDFWIPRAQPAIPNVAPWPFSFDAGEIAFASAPSFIPAEGFWRPSPPPGSYWNCRPFSEDGSFVTSAAPPFAPEEAFWEIANQSASANLYPQPWLFDTQEAAGDLFGLSDGDAWSAPLPMAQYQAPLVFRDEDVLSHAPVEGDFWSIAPRPAQLPFSPLYLPDGGLFEFTPPGNLHVDEDAWINPVASASGWANYIPTFSEADWVRAYGPISILGANTIPALAILDASAVPAMAILGASVVPKGW